MRLARALVVATVLGTAASAPTPAGATALAPTTATAPAPAPATVAGAPAGSGVGTAVRPGSASALAELRRSAAIPGTAWWTDQTTGGVVVAVDETVTGSTLDRVGAVVDRVGARLVHEPGTLRRRIAGGDPFSGGIGGRCNIGFNVRREAIFFLTSAHCVGDVTSTVYADPGGTMPLGLVFGVDPGHDYAIVRYTDPLLPKPSAVNVHGPSLQPITSVASGFVGQPVKRSGVATGVRSGTITGLNATVNYADGTVTGLIRTNVCAEPGDSGGPLFSGATALGMTSGGSGNCTTGGTTYFSSAARAMTQYSATVF